MTKIITAQSHKAPTDADFDNHLQLLDDLVSSCEIGHPPLLKTKDDVSSSFKICVEYLRFLKSTAYDVTQISRFSGIKDFTQKGVKEVDEAISFIRDFSFYAKQFQNSYIQAQDLEAVLATRCATAKHKI